MTEQEKYKRMAEMIKKIRQPSLNVFSSLGSSLSSAKNTLNDLGTTYTNPSFGVEKPEIYNNPNLKTTVPVGNLALGNSDRFFTNLSQDKKINPLDAIDAATLIPIGGLIGKETLKRGSNLISKLFDKPIGKPQQPNISYFDKIFKSSVFDKKRIKTKNINPDKKVYHEQKTLDGVMKNLTPYETDLNITLRRVAEKAAPKAEVSTRTKLIEKVKTKLDAGKNPENVSDIMGGRIAVDSADEIESVLKELSENANVVKIDNYYNPIGLEVGAQRDGYRAVHAQVLNSKGTTAEVQIIPKDYLPINDAGKNYYNAIRHGENKNSFEKLKNILLNKNSKFQRDELFKQLQKNPKSNLKNVAPIFPTYRGLLSE